MKSWPPWCCLRPNSSRSGRSRDPESTEAQWQLRTVVTSHGLQVSSELRFYKNVHGPTPAHRSFSRKQSRPDRTVLKRVELGCVFSGGSLILQTRISTCRLKSTGHSGTAQERGPQGAHTSTLLSPQAPASLHLPPCSSHVLSLSTSRGA